MSTIAICNTLYATPISVPNLLRDLDIVTSLPLRKNIEKILTKCDYCALSLQQRKPTTQNKPPTRISKGRNANNRVIEHIGDLINASNIHIILPILDKLVVPSVINKIFKLHIVPSVPYAMLTINHAFASYNSLIGMYVRGEIYNFVYNHDKRICIGENKNLGAAISAGLRVCNVAVCFPRITIDDIPRSTSRIEIHNECGNITSLAPLAKSLRHVISIASNKIGDDGLRDCNKIETLNASFGMITTCEPFADTLVKLIAIGRYCSINDAGLRLCTRIEVLNAEDNTKITTCAPFADTLVELYAGHMCGISDHGLSTCINICKLHAYGNAKITTCEPFAKSLIELDASLNCGINDAGLKSCFSIEILNASDNPKITTCAPFAKSLVKLNASLNCGINDAGLKSCYSIKVLDADNNPRITTCAPFAETLRVLYAFGRKCGICTEGLLLCHAIKFLWAYQNPKINKEYIESRNKKLAQKY